MLENLIVEFGSRFGRSPELAARAPGRVNLIGEHTDYNAGLVLPCAIDRETFVALARRSDTLFRVLSCDLGELREFRGDALERCGDWLDYVQGVVFALGAEGRAVGGCDLAIASRLPRESGLSSSAALEVSIATALALASGRRLGARDRARIAHRAETEFVGVGCGIMDQFASALGRRNHALFIDCRSEHVRPVRLPPQRLRLLIVDSGARRALAAGGYRERREQCEAALRAARASGIALAGARSLRDLEGTEMGDLERVLPRPLFRRVRHVLSENERVRAVGRAFEAGELVKVGELLRQGMRSLREDFEVSTPELDFLCARADSHPGVFGSRLTGAGFGGWSLHVVEPAAAADAAQWIACGFESRFGRRPPVLEVEAAEGAGEVALPGRG